MGEKLRVAIVSNYPLNPDKVEGGVRSVTQNLVHGLREYDDLDIHVVHCHSDIDEDRTVNDGNAVIHFLSRSKRRVIPNMLTNIRRIADVIEQIEPDVVSSHNGSYSVAGLLSGYPTIYTIHGIIRRYMWQAGGAFDLFRLFMEVLFDTYAASRVKEIVAISPYVLDCYRWASQARFHRVDNPVSEVYYAAQDRTVPGRILYAGVIAEVKNVMLLMKALDRIQRQVPEAHLHTAGWVTSQRYQRSIDQFLAGSRLREHISMLGFLDIPNLFSQYEEASVLVLSSKAETQPVVIIEAMAAGKPVVATDVGGVRDLVDDGETGFVVPSGDEIALAERVSQILRDPRLGRQMGEKGREKARRRFSIQRAAMGYRDVFLAVAGKQGMLAESLRRR